MALDERLEAHLRVREFLGPGVVSNEKHDPRGTLLRSETEITQAQAEHVLAQWGMNPDGSPIEKQAVD